MADDGVLRRLKIKTTRKRGLSVDSEETDAEALNKLADSIETLTQELQGLLKELVEQKLIARLHGGS